MIAEPSPDLVARWAAEPEWDGNVPPAPGRDDGRDLCGDCGGPLLWEPGRTRIFCQGCGTTDLPPAVFDHYERQQQRSREIAVPPATDEAADRAARVQLRARKDLARDDLEAWLETVADEESYDREQWQAQARQLSALLRGYLPEIDRADTEATLSAIRAEIDRILNGDLCRALRDEYEQAQERAERQHIARQRAAEYEREQREAAERAERERKAAERAALQSSQRKAITTGARPPAIPNGYSLILATIADSQLRRDREIQAHGECQFGHWGRAPASRIYGVPGRDWAGNMTGYRLPDTPAYLACGRHRAQAEARLRREGYPDIAWWEA